MTNPAPLPRAKRISYNGYIYKNYAMAAREIAPAAGRTFQAVRKELGRHHGDVGAVLEHFQRISLVVRDKTYRSRAEFGRRAAAAYKVPRHIMNSWIHSKRTPEQIIKLAKAWQRDHRSLSDEIVLFGWRFRTWTSLYRYYTGRGLGGGARHKWRDHLAAGRPICLYLPLAEKLVQLWQYGELDERNRFPPEVEGKMRRAWLPINNEPEEITNPFEIAMAAEMRNSARAAYLRFLDDPTAAPA